MTPREHLAQDQFKIEERLALFGRPVALVLTGFWNDEGTAEAMVGILATEPMNFCRISAAVHYIPGEPLMVGRVTEPDDPRDDDDVISRFFERPLEEIFVSIFARLHDALAAAAELREERAEARDEKPVRDTAAPAWVH